MQLFFLPTRAMEQMWLLFKLYCPESEDLWSIGGLLVPSSGRPIDNVEWLREAAGFAQDAEIILYKEDSAESIDQNSTYNESQLEDGSVVVYNNVLTGKERISHRCPDFPTFRAHSRNGQLLHLRRLSNPTVDEFCLELSNHDTYSVVVERVAQHFGLEGGSRVNLHFNDCFLQRPKPRPLDSGSYGMTLANAYQQTTSILYFEIVSCSPPEQEQDGLKTLTIAFHDGKREEISDRTIELSELSTRRDLVEEMRGMVQELPNPTNVDIDVRKSLKLVEDAGDGTKFSKSRKHADGTKSSKLLVHVDCNTIRKPRTKRASRPRISHEASRQAKSGSVSQDQIDADPVESSEFDERGILHNQTPDSQSLINFEKDSKSPQHQKGQASALVEKQVLTVVEKFNRAGSSKYVSPTPMPSAICEPSLAYTAHDREVSWIKVPSSEFHNFDSHRTEKDVVPGQVWAFYDRHDGMPRRYGLITQVCASPFEVELSWLEPCKTKRGWAEITGVSVTCGEYEKSMASEILKNIEVFSHLVLESATAVEGVVGIYPKQGEVWAIFRNWSELHMVGPKPIFTANGDFNQYYEYDIVRILDDYKPRVGLPSERLVKTRGFKAVFHPLCMGIKTVYRPEDLRKFSHRIPSEVMDEHQDEHSIPPRAVELDLASLPIELIVKSQG